MCFKRFTAKYVVGGGGQILPPPGRNRVNKRKSVTPCKMWPCAEYDPIQSVPFWIKSFLVIMFRERGVPHNKEFVEFNLCLLNQHIKLNDR